MEAEEFRRRSRRFRTPECGAEVDLRLVPQLFAELPRGARVRQLRAMGLERLHVRVVKAPRARTLGPQDAVKIEAPELFEDAADPTGYVRLEFLDLPPI